MLNKTMINNLLRIVLKGGMGSGNWGHIGRPGKKGGSYKGGGLSAIGAAPGMSHDYKKAYARQLSYKRKELKSEIIAAAKELGYPAGKIKFAGEPYDFKVDNDSFRAAADYNPTTGVIRLFSGSINTDANGVAKINRGILAHEITHDKFNTYEKKIIEQNAKITSILQEENKNNVHYMDSFIRPDGSIRDPKNIAGFEEYELDVKIFGYLYPAPARGVDRALSNTANEISPYAESYWKGHANHKVSTKSATNETLAEIARIKLENPKAKIPDMWEEVYNDFIKL